MTQLQPQLGDTRHQELTNSPLWPSSLFNSQLVKEGEDFVLKKGTSKDAQVLDHIKTSPFVVPTIRKEAPTGNTPMGATPLKAVTNRFPQVGGIRISEAPGVVFDPTPGDKGMETPLPNDSSKASLSPPVGDCLRSFRRDWKINISTNGYVLPFISKPRLVRTPLILSGYKALHREQALTSCIQSLLSKNAIERVENVKSVG